MSRRFRPLPGLRGRLMGAVGLQPTPRQHPASMPDHARPRLGRLPTCGPCEHLLQAFTAPRLVMEEVRHPGINLFTRDVCPALAVPATEISLQQGLIDDVPPAQAAQVLTHRAATRPRRGADQARQALLQRMPVDAPSQAPGLARVEGHVGATDAAPRVPGGPRMAPGDEVARLLKLGGWFHPTALIQPGARHGARPARWPTRRVAGWRRACRP